MLIRYSVSRRILRIPKRIEREKQEFVKFANEGIILELLNILDDLRRSVSLAEAQKQDP